MEKWLGLLGLMLCLSAVSHAGTPQENLYLGQAPLSNTSIWSSTASVTSAVNLTAAIAPAAGAGAASTACRVCLTKFIVQIPTTTVVSVLDGATTNYTLYGLGLAASGVNTIVFPEDHLGPLCAAVGDTINVNLINTGGAAVPQSFNYEGYTTCGGTANKGSMQ